MFRVWLCYTPSDAAPVTMGTVVPSPDFVIHSNDKYKSSQSLKSPLDVINAEQRMWINNTAQTTNFWLGGCFCSAQIRVWGELFPVTNGTTTYVEAWDKVAFQREVFVALLDNCVSIALSGTKYSRNKVYVQVYINYELGRTVFVRPCHLQIPINVPHCRS